jgi:hypothetical protein
MALRRTARAPSSGSQIRTSTVCMWTKDISIHLIQCVLPGLLKRPTGNHARGLSSHGLLPQDPDLLTKPNKIHTKMGGILFGNREGLLGILFVVHFVHYIGLERGCTRRTVPTHSQRLEGIT